MSSPKQVSEVLFDIALDIGHSLNLSEMLACALGTMLPKLSCLAGIVLADRRTGDRVWLEKIFSMSARDGEDTDFTSILQQILPQSPPGEGRTDWNNPKAHPNGEIYYFLFDLSGYGVLVLLSDHPMDSLLAQSLKPVCDKLAESCIACEKVSSLERKNATLRSRVQVLKKREHELREAQQLARIGTWNWDIKTGDVEWTEQVYKIFQLDPKEFKPQIDSIQALSPWPEDHQRDKELIQKAIDSHQPGYFEQRFLLPDGSTGYYASTYEGQYDENGNLIRMVGTVQDITELKRTEKELRKEKEFTETALNSQLDTFFLFELSTGKAFRWNRAFSELAGYTDEEIEQMPVPDSYYGPEDIERTRDFIQEVLKNGFGTIELELICKDGHKVPTEYRVSLMKDEAGNPKYFISIGRDITERKRTEEAREELEIQLRHAQKMEAIGQLTGGVAHDFNNLLQVINGATDLAITDLGPDHPVLGSLTQVAKAGKRAAELVSQLLLFSRRQIMRPVVLDLNTIIEDLLKMLNRVIGEQIQLEWRPGTNIATVYADHGMVEQTLMNLCVNARDAMPDGGTLTIETEDVVLDETYCATHSWAREGRYILLSVMDTGCGIEKEQFDHIFEPFYTTKQTGKGTGLGLATVYGIVKQHEGMIHVYSEPGKGTLFKLYWPVSGDLIEESDAIPDFKARGGTETILVAEDDEMVCNLARLLLERAGYTVVTAKNGAEAVVLFEQLGNKIDMVMLDVVMPQMGGREAYNQMRALRPDLKALFASGYSENAIHTNFVLDKGLSLIQKPFAPDALLRAIRETLDSEETSS